MAENREAAGAGERDAGDLESGGYEQVALALMRAIARDERTDADPQRPQPDHALGASTPTPSSRCPAWSTPNGAHPVAGRPAARPRHRPGLRGQGGRARGDRRRRRRLPRAAVKAFALHPLVDSVDRRPPARRRRTRQRPPGLAYLR